MDPSSEFEQLIEQLERMGMDVRYERLGGESTGLCKIRGRSVMFVDMDADVATRVDRCIRALATVPDVDFTYLSPTIRQRLDKIKKT